MIAGKLASVPMLKFMLLPLLRRCACFFIRRTSACFKPTGFSINYEGHNHRFAWDEAAAEKLIWFIGKVVSYLLAFHASELKHPQPSATLLRQDI